MKPYQGARQHAFVSFICFFFSKWAGVQFRKYITLFRLKHISAKTTCYYSPRKYLSTQPEALMLENAGEKLLTPIALMSPSS